jgi:hypothetical protein
MLPWLRGDARWRHQATPVGTHGLVLGSPGAKYLGILHGPSIIVAGFSLYQPHRQEMHGEAFNSQAA